MVGTTANILTEFGNLLSLVAGPSGLITKQMNSESTSTKSVRRSLLSGGQLCKNTLLSDIVWKACLSIGSFDIWGKTLKI